MGFPVYLTGDNTKDFIELAGMDDEVIPVDYANAVKPIREAVRVTIGREGAFGVSGFSALVREAKAIASGLGLDSMANPTFKGTVYLADPTSVDKVVDSYLVEQLGAEFLAPLIEQAACEQALKAEVQQSCVPVLVTNMPDSVRDCVSARIFGGRQVDATVNGEITDETVKGVFKSISTALKSGGRTEQ